MIKWIRGRLFSFDEPKRTGHIFECGQHRIHFEQFSEGRYPPFDCLNITFEDAIKLRDWLNKVIISHESI